MNKYLFLYRNPPGARPAPSPEEMQTIFTKWQAWKDKFKKNVVDLGDGLHEGGRLLKAGKVTDGPHAEAKEIIAGYSVISAESFDEALEVAKSCPMAFAPDAAIEIRQMMGY